MSILFECPKCDSTNTRISQGTPPHALRWDCDECRGWGWVKKDVAQNLIETQKALDAVVYLSSLCDGANELDGQGFNKYDAENGHRIANLIRDGEDLSFDDYQKAKHYAHKYRGQLEDISSLTEYVESVECEVVHDMNSLGITDDDVEREKSQGNLVPFIQARLNEYVPPVSCEVTTDEPIRHTSEYLEGLNNEQSHMFLRVVESVSKKFYLSVFARAGTGKTHTLVRSFAELKAQGKRVAMTAPTHKAKNVLAVMAKDFDIPCFTIQQMLGLTLRDYSRKGKKLLTQTSNGLYGEYDAVAIDEGSMCGYAITQFIPSNSNTVFIPIADRGQLPPVEEEDADEEQLVAVSKESPFFDTEDYIELNKIVRYDGAILKACTAIYDNPTHIPKFQFEQGSLERLDGNDWENMMLADFKTRLLSGELEENPDALRVLAWSNDSVARLNNAVRSHLFGRNVQAYEIGERLMAKEAIEKRLDRFSYERTVIMYSCAECTVLGSKAVYIQLNDLGNEGRLFRSELRDVQAIRAYKLLIQTDLGQEYEIDVIDRLDDATVVYVNEFFARWKSAILEFKNNRNNSSKDVSTEWARYYEGLARLTLRETKKLGYVAKLQPSFALTVHQSQGSTIDNVYLSRDILACKDLWFKRKLLYTACSRASKLLRVKGV